MPLDSQMYRLDVRRLMREFTSGSRRSLHHPMQRGARSRRVLCTLDLERAGIRVELPPEAWVPLAATEPNYGGVRYWGRCPRCDARVGVLFLSNNSFECRRCADVQYASTVGSEAERAASQLAKARSAFTEPILFGIPPERPKGMTRHQYAKCLARLKACERRCRDVLSPDRQT